MYCSKCGEQIPDEAVFCAKCGAPVNAYPDVKPSAAPAAYAPETPEAAAPGLQKAPRKAMGKKAKVILLASLALAVVLIGVFAFIMITEGEKEARYTAAIELMNAGKTGEAKAAFIELKDYKTSADLAEKCQAVMDYEAAKAKMDSGDYAGAIEAFALLGDYGESGMLAKECRNKLDYDAAVALKDAGNLEAARDAFAKLKDYSDAAAQAQACQNRINYDDAKALMAGGDYAGAAQAFTNLGDFEDSAALAFECSNQTKYLEADAAFKEGKFYTAYELFSNLGGFSDSASRAQACIQKKPATKELYRNKKYSKKSCSVTIKTAKDNIYTYIKIYAKNGDLASILFIAPGKSLKVKLPSGAYKFKEATSSGDWFGEKEMFGPYGNYELMLFDNGSETWSLSSRYIYTLTLRNTKDGNVGVRDEDPATF